MAIVTFLSAKGSPGATTTALLAAALWPRPAVLVEADPAGGDLAARVPAADGSVLDADRGLLPLLTSARRGLTPAQVLEQTQLVAGGSRVVVGLGGSEQALAAGQGWSALAGALRELTRHQDVLLDAGRVGADPVHLDLLRASDVVVLVVRAEAGAVLHARERLRVLSGALRRPDGLLPRLGVLVVGDLRRRAREADDAAALLTGAGDRADDFGRLPLDPAGAAVFDGARTARPERTALVRAGRAVVGSLADAATGSTRRSAA
ncbi:hypothetical protein [Kineococcus aurantiacus]|uniref:MinD-like ATPase involved in chromosome partitioning or flagellar assembly n=1 Tax=Kineococcus aurantiacus TaxID=37633 RepID=A0A7Y9DJH5_9ACTN|nr:hypothetical protein [Kineococcus aurantiacus]NYD20937.1 MinD-like ATPase involved in chromosome partitioning or flagellar assembly [Kineococcus aurantiacus]